MFARGFHKVVRFNAVQQLGFLERVQHPVKCLLCAVSLFGEPCLLLLFQYFTGGFLARDNGFALSGFLDCHRPFDCTGANFGLFGKLLSGFQRTVWPFDFITFSVATMYKTFIEGDGNLGALGSGEVPAFDVASKDKSFRISVLLLILIPLLESQLADEVQLLGSTVAVPAVKELSIKEFDGVVYEAVALDAFE